ncbi:winged helix-turn-helix domain-containing protein [Streptomyces collinus]|uniref:helix-turn-helix domain-containing protein n=1 Tax=Streptomyces collinus TaxID=42684 RepID=UPI0029427F85|nr:winged helix-turn-helix domain-containing protein [Streptomyces collinus]
MNVECIRCGSQDAPASAAGTYGGGRWLRTVGRPWPSKDPACARCTLDARQLRLLATVLDAGPDASGFSDQCWTLARIAEAVRRHFGVEYTLAGLDLLLHRIGWSVQVPSRKADPRGLLRPSSHPAQAEGLDPGRRGWVRRRRVPGGPRAPSSSAPMTARPHATDHPAPGSVAGDI